jgi:hypothetical protein
MDEPVMARIEAAIATPGSQARSGGRVGRGWGSDAGSGSEAANWRVARQDSQAARCARMVVRSRSRSVFSAKAVSWSASG